MLTMSHWRMSCTLSERKESGIADDSKHQACAVYQKVVKRTSIIILLLLTATTFASRASAQSASGESNHSTLRVQLLELEAQIDQLKVRLQELQEALLPDNIERALVGVGSTRPEEMRTQLRRRLTIESEGVQKQLGLLEEIRARMGLSIANENIHSEGSPASDGERSAFDREARLVLLKLQLVELDYELQPENIERTLLPFGSTRPEEVRDRCRRLLSAEKEYVLAQIKLLESIQSPS